MKNMNDKYAKIRSILAIALAAVIGFSMAACGGDTGDSGDDGDSDSGWTDYPLIGTSVPGNSLKEKLNWLKANAQSDNSYTITVDKNEALKDDIYTLYEDECNELIYPEKDNVTVLLTGGKTVNIKYMSFIIGDGVTLVLEKVTIKDSTVSVRGALEMKYGAKIADSMLTLSSNSTFTMDSGEITGSSAVRLSSNSTFTMNGGTISGCDSLFAAVSGTKCIFTMNGGEISGNKPIGGVDINGTFTMNGGKVSGNTSKGSGGGVAVSGTFTMTGGEISGNTATGSTDLESINSYGGGVYVSGSGGTFTMSGGTISGNTAGGLGGGVFLANNVNFIMSGGTISGNTSYFEGGGVYQNGNNITMTGGEISGNIVYAVSPSDGGGGGIYLSSSGTLTKTGGTITGYADDTQNGNMALKRDGTVLDNAGHAVYKTGGGKRRETTAGPGVNIDTSKSGAEGGWE